ncbi:MAG: amidohydrolase family protein [Pyrinomonadaceae bacterium]
MFRIQRLILAILVLCTPTSVSFSIAQKSVGPALERISIRVNEGTNLGFDVSADGRTIVFDLLGQLWLVPRKGGKALPITDAVRDVAEDNDPSFSPDGHSVIFSGERNGRTGLWLLDLRSGVPRQLTQIPDPDGFDRDPSWSPDGHSIAFTHAVPPNRAGAQWRTAISVMEVASGNVKEVSISGIQTPMVSFPVWVRGGTEIAFLSRTGPNGGRIWLVPAAGDQARPVTEETLQVRSPAFAAGIERVAYFAKDKDGRTQLWVQNIGSSPPVRLTNQTDVTPTRVRWIRKENALLYTANGRLWTVAYSGGEPSEIKFTSELSITRPSRPTTPAHFPEPGKRSPARGFMGLALSPDGRRIGILALGKLWLMPIGGTPKAIAHVPFNAASLSWSPNGTEVVWSAGSTDHEDLYSTNLSTGVTRQVTELPGREIFPAFSPDGRYIAFIHSQDDGVLRVVDARAPKIADVAQTQDLGSIGSNWTCTPQWSPESDGLLVCGGTDADQLGHATFVPLSGQRQTINRFPDAPIFLRWTAQKKIVFVRHDRLWQAKFDRTGMLADPEPLGSDAAMYASTSDDGTVLFFSAGGLRLRSPVGTEQKIGFPLTYTSPIAVSMLIRNVRIIDGTGAPPTGPRDILIELGRIAKIAPSGTIPAGNAQILDAAGRIAIPGLMDLHAHTYRPDLLPGFVYFGVTTVRDQGSSMGPLASYVDDIASGALPGPRIGYGGFQFYSDWAFDEEQGRGIEPEADPQHIKRAIDLAEAFGAQHIKTRTFRRWDINARMIADAHRRGMRATGHCSHLLPLIAAGMDAKEHFGSCESRGDTHMYDDMIQLFRAAGIGVVPTISYFGLAVGLSGNQALLDTDAELAPFMPEREAFEWMFKLKGATRDHWIEEFQNARTDTAKLARAGVTIGTGTDIWQVPVGTQMELEHLVAAGLSPLEAIRAGTGGAAQILGAEKDLGTIEVGKWADLVILDADPLADIRNTRRIWQVVQYGKVVDRQAILKLIRPR